MTESSPPAADIPKGNADGEAAASERAIPLLVVTGFLGAGKTTLINRLLNGPALADTAVIVNEFGSVDLDSRLIEAVAADGIVALSNGCVCCSARGALLDRVADLIAPASGRKPPARILVETTGIADPAPILAGLATDARLRGRVRVDAVTAVVDHVAGREHLRDRDEARRQVVLADRLVLTKADLAAPEERARLNTDLAALNPLATVHETAEAGFDARAILLHADAMTERAARHDGRGGTADSGSPHDHGHHRHHAISTLTLETDRPMSVRNLVTFCEVVVAGEGPRLLRLKGLVLTVEEPDRPLLVQITQGHAAMPTRLGGWPDRPPRKTRLVAIGEAIDRRAIENAFAACAGIARADAPDRAALTDNPLAVPGFSF